MTKTAKVTSAVVAPDAAAPAPEVMTQTFIDITQQPRKVQLSGMTYNVFPQSVALARLGYVFDPAMPPLVYPQTNMTILHMILGMPDEYAVRGAREAVAEAAATEEREYLKAVEDAAARLIDERAASARKAESDAKIAAAEAALVAARMEAKAAA